MLHRGRIIDSESRKDKLMRAHDLQRELEGINVGRRKLGRVVCFSLQRIICAGLCLVDVSSEKKNLSKSKIHESELESLREGSNETTIFTKN